MTDLSDQVRGYYLRVRRLSDGRWIGLQTGYGDWALHIGIDEVGYADAYWFKRHADASLAYDLWDGQDDPPGHWYRHLNSGRRRSPDPPPAHERIY